MEIIIDFKARKEYTVELRKGGENYLQCPKCSAERTKKSLKPLDFNFAKGCGHCNHCGTDFVLKKDRETTPPRPDYKKPPEWTNTTALPDNVVKWFKEQRGISQRVLNEMRVTHGMEWMPQTDKEESVVKFNYFRNNEVVNIKYRDGKKNFKMFGGAELIFYNIDSLIGQKECYITEGEIDCLSFIEAGIPNVVSVPNGAGKGNLKLDYLDNCWEYFEAMDKIYLATDDDEAGRVLQEELSRRLGKDRCYKVLFGGHKDANELLTKDPLSFTETVQKTHEYPIEGVFTAADIEAEIWDLKRNGMKPACDIGVSNFDKLLTFEGGYLTVVTGVIGHGKSEWVDQMTIGLNLRHGWKTAFYSPENWPIKYHHSKMSSKMSGRRFSDESDPETKAGIEYAKNNFFFVLPEKDFSIDNILETARRLVKKYGIRCFVIDAWNKLEHKFEGMSETQYISRELDKIDMFCKTNMVHCFLVAHPFKMKKDKGGILYEIPDLYSISGSASFANKCANGICVYRRFFTDADGTLSKDSMVEVYVQKVKFKHWGERGCATLRYDYDSGRYYETRLDRTNWIYKEPEQTKMELPAAPPKTITQNRTFTDSAAIKEQRESDYVPREPDPFDKKNWK